MKTLIHRILIIMAMVSAPLAVAENHADVVVYDSTPAGFCAAIAAAREGVSVILLEPSNHVGGVNTGGLSFSDSFGSLRETLGGLWREWHERIAADYAARDVKLPYRVDDTNQVHWTYEPHVAMRVTRAMLDEAKVTVLTGRYLSSVEKSGANITKLVTKNSDFTGKVFIDASYEGDLMAAAGVAWTIGREGRGEFGESHAGVHHGQKKPTAKISGFDDMGKPLPFITGTELPPRGTADDGIQVFSFRLCLTRNPENRVPMPEPENYDPAEWEIARRFYAAHGHKGVGFSTLPLPNGKFDGNDSIDRLMSLGLVGGGQEWCEADEAGRQAIWEAHKQYTLGLYHFLSTDPSLPEEIRKQYSSLGLCKDEFAEYGHFSPELYVRQGRRMKGETFMTQDDIDKNPSKDDAIAVSSFPADAHDVTRIALKDGGVVTEGAFLHWATDGPGARHGFPYHIPYHAIIPKKDECANLLVPVALSGTHVVICSVRVEPTWMTIGHSAGVAAAMAAQRGVAVQDLPYADLKPRLEKQGQRLALPEESRPAEGMVLDDADAELAGTWTSSKIFTPHVGKGYVYSGEKDAVGDGKATATFRLKVPKSGEYELRMAYSPDKTRATNVPVTVLSGTTETKFAVDQTQPLPAGQTYRPIGKVELHADADTNIRITNADTTGFVILDAFQLVPAE